MTTPYQLKVPSKWAPAPKRFSFTSLQTIGSCPRRWQLVQSAWGTSPRFPERWHPSAVEGQIVHEALDRLSRALSLVGRPPVGSPAFQAAATQCGFWEFFAAQVETWNAKAADHPRKGPGFVIRTAPRELANRAIRLFREQYQSGAPGPVHAETAVGAPPASLLARLHAAGALTEVWLDHPKLLFGGMIDLVALDSDAGVVVVDFKTGASKDAHRDQLLLYAMLWWRATGTVPARIEIQYLHDRWAAPVTKADLERTERGCAKDIAAAVQAIGRQPAPARAGADCARCPVRARCDDGWPHTEAGATLAGRTVDCEVTVTSAPTPTGFTSRRRDGRDLPVVYDAAIAQSLPPLSMGSRLRLIGAVPAADGKSLEVRPWSECYLL